MKVLIVKLSSLGDVVHTMPAVQDLRAALPNAQIDWVVERGFAPLVQRCQGVRRVIPADLRRWVKAPLAATTRQGWTAFRNELQCENYDAVIDAQGLTKSGVVARLARLSTGGKRYALGNRTDGAGWEPPTRWVADVAIRMEPHTPAVARSRELCARALGYTVQGAPHFGLLASAQPQDVPASCVVFVHGTSRDDKCWPVAHWIEAGRRLVDAGHTIGLPHGSDAEQRRSEEIAAALGDKAHVWPRLDLGSLTDWMAGCAGVIGVDSGLSHIAVALDLPHVQIYNFATAWRTGPLDVSYQRSVYAQPCPTVDAVWQCWQQVSGWR